MKTGKTKLSKKVIIIVLSVLAVVFAAVALIVHQATKITNESYENCALGDVNGDGYINSIDALYVIDHITSGAELFENQLINADVNKDEGVDSMDALILLRYAVGDVKKLPFNENGQQGNETSDSKKASFVSDKFETEVSVTNDWEADGVHMYQLSVTVKNVSGSDIGDWKTSISLSEEVKISKKWNCSASVDGETITVEGDSAPDESAVVCGVIAEGTDKLIIKNIETE